MIDLLKHAMRTPAALASNPLVARDIAGALSRGAFNDAWRMARTARRTPDLRTEKIVSRKYRFLWMSIPKAASRSIMAALRNADPDAEVMRGMRIRDIHATCPEAKDYYSFAFVRHPFARTFSWYREVFFAPGIYAEQYHLYEGKKDRRFFDPVADRTVSTGFSLDEAASPLHKAQKSRSFFDAFYGLEETTGFDDLCRWLHTPYGSDAFADRHFLSQHLQIRLEDGRLPDFVGRFENLDADLNWVAGRLGLPAPALPMLNTMAGWQATQDALQAARSAANDRLTERNKALLRARYAGDLELWLKAGERR